MIYHLIQKTFGVYLELYINLLTKKNYLMFQKQMELNNKGKLSSFIQNTYQIFHDQENIRTKLICWDPSGKQFYIRDMKRFQQHILPEYFRHNKINSFIRQLNMYGFHKKRGQNGKHVFFHPYFVRNQENLLIKISKKPKEKLQQEQCVKIQQKQENIYRTASKKHKISLEEKQQLLDTENNLKNIKQKSYQSLYEQLNKEPSFNFLQSNIQKITTKHHFSSFKKPSDSQQLPACLKLRSYNQLSCASIQDAIHFDQEDYQKFRRSVVYRPLFQSPTCFFKSMKK